MIGSSTAVGDGLADEVVVGVVLDGELAVGAVVFVAVCAEGAASSLHPPSASRRAALVVTSRSRVTLRRSGTGSGALRS